MPVTELVLNIAVNSYRSVAPEATETAVRAFMANLGESRCPSHDELQSAMNASHGKLRERLFSHKTIGLLGGSNILDDKRIDAIALKFRQFELPLNCPPLPAFTELTMMRMPLVAMLGAVLGALIGSPIGIYLLAMRDVGLLVGAPIGAFVMTWGLENASRNPWVSRFLITTLGVATVAEVWAYLSMNPLAAVWRKLSGRSSIQRIAIYLVLISLVIFTRRRSTYDRTILEESVRQTIEDWLRGALLVLSLLIEQSDNSTKNGRSDEKAMAELGKRIMELNFSSSANLLGHAQDVVDAAREAGFEGLDKTTNPTATDDRNVLTWVESMRERYDSFGFVEEGDAVYVEQEPVIRSGDLLKKGLVRKQRGN